MDRLKELYEAKNAAQQVIARIDNAISSLDSASSWGIFDILGGEFFTSLVKREKIRNANQDIQAISDSLNTLNRELEDVNMFLPEEISDSLTDNVFDIWFDNIFTDFMVQGEIKDKLMQLREFRTSIKELIGRLDDEIDMLK